MHDRTLAAVTRQIKAMASPLYEVGIRHASRGMLHREWTAEALLAALAWLKHENQQGCDVYIRPARSAPSRLVLIDDLTLGELARLKAGAHAPAVVVQTSPGNHQAWVKLQDDVLPAVRREIARILAREYGGDPNSADSAHFGRLAGFTNRKPERITEAGRAPFVLLDSYAGLVAPGAAQLLDQAAQAASEAASMSRFVGAQSGAIPQPLAATSQAQLLGWYGDLWRELHARFGSNFDASRADWMAAIAMFRAGHSFADVRAAIEAHSPGLAERKGSSAADYVLRTAGKAQVWVDLRRQGAAYAEVADSLLSLAVERSRA